MFELSKDDYSISFHMEEEERKSREYFLIEKEKRVNMEKVMPLKPGGAD